MFRFKRAALLAAAVTAFAGCTQKPVDTAPIEAMIRAHTTGWVEAYNAGDADKIVAGYTDDAILMPPDAPAATGHEAMKQFLVADMAAAKTAGTTLALDSDTIGVAGDVAWHSGTFHVNGSAGAPLGTGKYLEVWHQDKGNWLMIRDIWNMDAPAAAPAPPPPPPKAAAPPKKKHKSKKK